MKIILKCLLFVLLIASGAYYLVWPNTYLSQDNISFLPKPLIRFYLKRMNTEYVKVTVDNEEKKLKYSDLGMTLDVDATMERLRIKSLTDLIDKWKFSLSGYTLTHIEPIFIISDKFDLLVSQNIPDKGVLEEKFSYDKNNGVFTYSSKERGARLDRTDLQSKLVALNSFREKRILINRIPESSYLEKKVQEVNSKLSTLARLPLEIIIEGTNQKIEIGSQDMLSLFDVGYTDNLRAVQFVVDKDSLSRFLATTPIRSISVDWVSKKIKDTLVQRYNDGVITPMVLGIDTGPNTDGSLARTYIEVDMSQQKLYFFEGGEIFKSYSVSTGLNYATPTGRYKIRNKSPMGFSGIFNVWMPWWMAFDYRNDIGAYLGIHELPYKLIGGIKIYRFGNYIGTKKTGGCIALSPGDSKEVYDKSFIGMDIVIYP